MNNMKLTSLRTIRNFAQAEAAVADLTAAMKYRRELEARCDAELLKVRSRYEATFARIDAAVQPRLAALRDWAEASPAAFEARKSIEFAAGTVGFRTNPPKLKTLRGFTWEMVVRSLRAGGLGRFIRVREEVDREALIAARREFSAAALKKVGLALARDESFYVEPALTAPQTALRKAA